MAALEEPASQTVTVATSAALAWFERYLVAVGRAPLTRRLYVAAAARWLAYGGAPGHVDRLLAARYFGARRLVVAQATLNVDVTALRSFYRALAAAGHAAAGQDRMLPPLRRPAQRMVRWLTEDQLAAVFAAPDVRTWLGFRDHVILRTLFESGLRAGELARLTVGDVLEDRMLFVHQGKGARDRYVPVSADLLELLHRWCDRRGAARPGRRSALFLTRAGAALTRRTVWEIVSRHARAALGLACGFQRVRSARSGPGRAWQGHSPHVLRASLATALHARGMPLPAIADVLGHANLETTLRYVAVDVEALRRECAKLPRAGMAGAHAATDP